MPQEKQEPEEHGLSAEDLEAETAAELPEREAMSLVDPAPLRGPMPIEDPMVIGAPVPGE